MSLSGMMGSTAAMRAIFGARGTVQAMLDVEAALARAHEAVGAIGGAAAEAIAGACDAGGIDLVELADQGAHAGTIVIPLVAWLRAQVPDHAASVHRAGTSQDVIDTGLVLQIGRGLALLGADASAMAAALLALAQAHEATPMLARTLMQPALPTSFGLKATNWLAAIDDARLAIRGAADAALVLQCGGAAGTLDGLGGDPAGFLAAFAGALGLKLPALPWHTNRARLARLGCAVAAGVGALGKIATDIALLMQGEIGELAEPAAPGRGGSSAMAHKRNPTLSIAARTAAVRAPHLAATLLAALPQEHERAAGAWQAEPAVWAELMLLASGAFAAMRTALAGLVVDPGAMARNLAAAPAAASEAIPFLIRSGLAEHDMITKALEP